MSLSPPKELLEFLSRYDPAIQDLALTVREFVLSELAPPSEHIINVYVVAMGYGPSAKMKDQVCYIGVNTAYVNLGFHRGTELDDPHGLLEGTGTKMRHVKIRSAADLSHPGIRELLATAWVNAGLGPTDRSPDGEVVSTFGGSAAQKPAATRATKPRPRRSK
jgi:hypothetical protein